MPKLEIVVGADATLVLPCLVIANYLTRRELLPDLTKSLLQERSLGGAGVPETGNRSRRDSDGSRCHTISY